MDWFPLGLSLRVALLATIITAIIGVPAAWLLARRHFAGRDLVSATLLTNSLPVMSLVASAESSNLKLVGHLSWAPPFPGSNHTCWPLGDRPYLICTDEARAKQKYWDAQFMWVIDARKEDKLTPIATFMPDREKYFNRPGRYGAHNILEHLPADGPWKDIVFLTYFNAGLRAVNVSDPFHPKEIGCYVPALEGDRPAVQSNDIGTDEHGRLYLIDRAGAGMHILEYTG